MYTFIYIFLLLNINSNNRQFSFQISFISHFHNNFPNKKNYKTAWAVSIKYLLCFSYKNLKNKILKLIIIFIIKIIIIFQ